MPWNKKATVFFHQIESMDDDFFVNFQNTMQTLLASGSTSETFESGGVNMLWKLFGEVEICSSPTFFCGVVKERSAWPVWFREDGSINGVPLADGSLGELSYAFVNPAERFVISVAGGSGLPVPMFKRFLNLFTADGSVQLTPVFVDDVDSEALGWDMYRKLQMTLTLPTADDVTDLMMTDSGGFLKVLDELGGLKVDVTVSMNKDKGSLAASRVRDFVAQMIANEFCNKLVVRGGPFEEDMKREFDLKNAQLKFSSDVEVADSFMSDHEARQLLTRAFNEHRDSVVRPV